MRKSYSNMHAFDASSRTYDVDGRLHVKKSVISKAAVNPYYGLEIPGYEGLGLDPEKVYQLYRDPDALAAAAPTFARLPILDKHIPVSVDALPEENIVGAIGSDVAFEAPYLVADLCFWTAGAIAGIEEEVKRELSCSYRYTPVMTPGEIDGVAYDGIMTEIIGNHLALVERGRAGRDAVVADADIKNEVNFMKITRKGKALFAALACASAVLAADAATIAVCQDFGKKTWDAQDCKKKLLAIDSDLDPQKLDDVIDALLGVEQSPEPVLPVTPAAGVGDASPAEQIKALLAGKVDEETLAKIMALCAPEAQDVEPEEKDVMKKEDVDKAMDAMRSELIAAEQARRDVREIVGDTALDMSAEDVYKFALDQMSIKADGVTGVAATRALFSAVMQAKKASVPAPKHSTLATDKALNAFPGLARLK